MANNDTWRRNLLPIQQRSPTCHAHQTGLLDSSLLAPSLSNHHYIPHRPKVLLYLHPERLHIGIDFRNYPPKTTALLYRRALRIPIPILSTADIHRPSFPIAMQHKPSHRIMSHKPPDDHPFE